MICPKCGTENPGDAAACSECGYKFRFGHAFDDPNKMTFLGFSGSRSKLIRSAGYVFVVLLVIFFILIIFSWFQSL